MVEAVMLWNEPNNLSHWDFKLDPDWKIFAGMVIAASKAIRKENPELPIVLGGISPIDPNFIELLSPSRLIHPPFISTKIILVTPTLQQMVSGPPFSTFL